MPTKKNGKNVSLRSPNVNFLFKKILFHKKNNNDKCLLKYIFIHKICIECMVNYIINLLYNN